MNVYRKSSPRCECLAKLTFLSEIMTADEKKMFHKHAVEFISQAILSP